MATTTTPDNFLDNLRAVVGIDHVLVGDLASHNRDWRGKYVGSALAVVRPADTAQVQAVVRLCAELGVAIVPQGGNTSMCGGSVPDATGTQIVLSLSRLNRVRSIDPGNNTMTVEAGCVLQTLQETAMAAGRLLPLSLGAEGSCQIGGNVSTNAGGVQVLRYGNTRDLVLGLEVVLPDGELLDLMRGLRKDNSGYDLKQWYIGSEGTLGVITAAVLKLFPAPASTSVAYAALASLDDAVALLHTMRAAMGERFTAFEVLSAQTIAIVCQQFPDTRLPLDATGAWSVLMEASDVGDQSTLDEAMQAALSHALEAGLISDVAIASSQSQAAALWQLRENVPEAQQREGANIKHDISVAVSAVPAFVAEVLPLLETHFPGSRPIVFGHLGDGNLHFNVAAPPGVTIAEWQQRTDEVNLVVHDTVARHRGSISAEHGIGQLKRHELAMYKTPTELAVMWSIKRALDPLGIMNPGKVLPDSAT